jgi:hypothetical protein
VGVLLLGGIILLIGGDECMLAGIGEYIDESSKKSVSGPLSPISSGAAPSETGIVASDDGSAAGACAGGSAGRLC